MYSNLHAKLLNILHHCAMLIPNINSPSSCVLQASGSEFQPALINPVQPTNSEKNKSAAFYALGIGACASDDVDKEELKYVYHENNQKAIKVLPTFAAFLTLESLHNGFDLPGLQYDPRLLVHGQQYIELYKPFPSSCHAQNKVSLVGLYDKGKATILEIETKDYEKESGDVLCVNRSRVYLRVAGGFSKSSKLFSYSHYSSNQTSVVQNS
ncbi:unnamed protein product [Vicia faba]|uniref:Peroxisomal multifunctional enzyme type 2-like N-terminal domain-containing protein n=1 Tax=Vicia faba TaxID=3906 RepID=A0AAV0ZSK9_VICFA|nr:unnamed protein product [Vicia faba]